MLTPTSVSMIVSHVVSLMQIEKVKLVLSLSKWASNTSIGISLIYSWTFCFSATGFGYIVRCTGKSWLGLVGIAYASPSGSWSFLEAFMDAVFLDLSYGCGKALFVIL